MYGKGSKTRRVLMNEETWNEVMSLHTAASGLDDYVFQSRQAGSTRTGKADRRLDESTVFRIVRAAAARAGLETIPERVQTACLVYGLLGPPKQFTTLSSQSAWRTS